MDRAWADVFLRGFEANRPRVIAALHTEAIADAAGIAAGRTPVRLCSDEAQLDECLAGSWTPVILAELGSNTSPLMLSRLMRAGKVPIVAMLPSGQLPVSQIISLALSGARFEVVHSAAELSYTLRLATSLPAIDSEIGEVVRSLSWRLDRATLEDVAGLMILGRRQTTVSEALGRLDRTAILRTALRDRSLPTPARLLGWGGALHLIWQMERYGRDFAEAALHCGFESSRQCSDAFKFHCGSAPMNVLRGAGFEGMLDELVRRLGRVTADVDVAGTALKATEYLRISA